MGKNESDPEKASVEFVLAVLKQHEIEFERIISQLEILVDIVNEVVDKLQQKIKKDFCKIP